MPFSGLLLYLILLVILCALGFWQIQRAEEKRQFLHQQKVAGRAERIDLNRLDRPGLKALEYKKVKVTGHYDSQHQFLIDIQIKNGQVGYFVMTPFLIAGHKQAVLVNRGWVQMNKDRTVKPEIALDQTETEIMGRVNHFPVVGFKLTGADVPTEGWPAVVQLVNTDILTTRLGYPLLDFQIELDAEMAQGYGRDWKEQVIMPAEKHIAYAVQWFALAITLTILFAWYCIKKK